MMIAKIRNKISILKQKVLIKLGSGVECNVCGTKVMKFKSDLWHQFAVCPNCKSHIRQRLLMASLTHIKEFNFKSIIKNKVVLHFAPDKCLRSFFKKSTDQYLTTDFMAEGYHYDGIDYNLDMSSMPSMKDNTIDVIIALDVLEHVPNYIEALNEVYRVLKIGGVCIFTIPQKDGLEKTFEDSNITTSADRETYYGQWDHLRIYGSDFSDSLKNAGFQVSVIDEKNFPLKLVKKHVLFPPVLSKNQLATNYRKVYFGVKK